MSEFNQTVYVCAIISAFYFGYTYGKSTAYRDIARRIFDEKNGRAVSLDGLRELQ